MLNTSKSHPNSKRNKHCNHSTLPTIYDILIYLYERDIYHDSDTLWIDNIDNNSRRISVLNPKSKYRNAFDKSEFNDDDFNPYASCTFVDDIVQSDIWKTTIQYKAKLIEYYSKGRTTPKKDKSKRKIPASYLVDFFMCRYGVSNEEAIHISKLISSIKQKATNGKRYRNSLKGSYSNLSPEIREFFFLQENYIALEDNDNNDLTNGITTRDINVSDEVFQYLLGIKTEIPPGNRNQYLIVSYADYMKFSFLTQMKVLKSIKFCDKNYMYLEMHNINEPGNYGRRYNLLDEIPKVDRELISNLYGVDISTCLQAIILAKFPELDLPFTKSYVEKKSEMRKQIAEDNCWNIDRAKMEITAIYQGRGLTNRNKKLYEKLTHIFEERNLISNAVFNLRTQKSKPHIKYAISRTNDKATKKINISDFSLKNYDKYTPGQQFKIRNSFLFFYWTFFEREIQDIISSKFTNEKTLHDGVYTQDKEEFDRLNIKLLEDEIFEKTQIRVTLDKQ